MEYRHELIPFSSQMPGKIFLHKIGGVPRHWHRSLEILVILSGQAEIIVEDRRYMLNPTDVCVINSLSPHEIYSSNAEAVAFQTNPAKTAFSSGLENCYFDCCSAGDTANPKYNFIRHLIARLIKENASEENLLLSYSLIAQLLNELQTNFSVPLPEQIEGKRNALSQMGPVTDFILANFKDNLSLQDVADHFHYSPSYLSRCFKQNLKMTFLDFYTSIRLENAVNDLVTTKESINAIALNNGFHSSRSFVTAFQEKYGMLPSEYRQNHSSLRPQEKAKTEVNYLAVTNSNSLSALAPFLEESTNRLQSQEKIQKLKIGSISTNKKQRQLIHTWNTVCCVGSTRDLLFEDVRQMLRRLQSEIGYKYVKFHGLLSDDLMLYDELSDGSYYLSFVLFDKVIDFLLSIGLKPWMQLSFMPKALASNKDRNSFFIQQNCSLPKSIDKWTSFISDVVKHCIERYTLEEVLTWPFCVWNEPDTTVDMFGFKEKEDFFSFYEATYKTVKRVNPNLKVGSPSLLLLLDDPLNWYQPFFDYCIANHCTPDFLNLHFYNDDITFDTAAEKTAERRERLINCLDSNPNAFKEYLRELEKKKAKYGFADLPIYLTEWNLTVSHRNLLNDTCFKACYLTKNLLENYDKLSSFGYWSLTDLLGESQLPKETFHGGLGLFTVNQIPKAHFFTFRMLKSLEDTLVSSGEGWFVTKNVATGKIAMILYNYHHYNQIISAGELFDMTPTERYTAFTSMTKKEISMTLEDMKNRLYMIKETFVNRNNGSSYDNWVNMGGVEPMTNETIELLSQISRPGLHISKVEVKDNTLKYKQVLEPFEVRLVEIEPV